ncbi:MAG: sigma-70 family RNA polymerase sigma factor [Planctomycetes bacterium]|nr:sigma-70 family RNA polymerase sigma factor [Planctomycetota bacterium]
MPLRPSHEPTTPLDTAAFDAATECELARAARAGEPGARDRLVETLARLPAMLRGKNARLGGLLRPADLDDALQSAMLAVWQKLDRYDGRGPLLHWAYGFAVVELRRLVERRGRRREQEAPEEVVASAPEPPRHDPELVQRAVACLDETDRRIVTMKHHDELTFDQIAPAVGMPTNTVKTRYYRALVQLRHRLAPHIAEERA